MVDFQLAAMFEIAAMGVPFLTHGSHEIGSESFEARVLDFRELVRNPATLTIDDF